MYETVFFVEAAEKCTHCKGTGVDVDGERIDRECPHCDGKGWFDRYSADFEKVPEIVNIQQEIDALKKQVEWQTKMIEIIWRMVYDK